MKRGALHVETSKECDALHVENVFNSYNYILITPKFNIQKKNVVEFSVVNFICVKIICCWKLLRH
jgi:hypothetical protein